MRLYHGTNVIVEKPEIRVVGYDTILQRQGSRHLAISGVLRNKRQAMSNIYFPDEQITFGDLYFVCYMIERVARSIKQRNRYVVERLG